MLAGIILLLALNQPVTYDSMLLPVSNGKIITLEKGSSVAHRGIFIQPTNDFNVKSCSDGKVQNLFRAKTGWVIVIANEDTLFTYAQLDSAAVNPGWEISKGDLIGRRKLIPGDYKSIIFFILKGKKELDPEKYIREINNSGRSGP